MAEQTLADQTASVNDLKTILYLVHAQHMALTDAIRFHERSGFHSPWIRRLTFPVASTAKASRNHRLGLTNAQQRQDEKISARGKQAKLENEIKDATEFLASIREKLTTKQAVSVLTPTSTRSTYFVLARDRGNIHSNLSSSSKFRVNYLKRKKWAILYRRRRTYTRDAD